jgi:hypothetical protein
MFSEELCILSLQELEDVLTFERAKLASAEKAIGELKDRRHRMLLEGDCDAVADLDNTIKSRSLTVESAAARISALQGPLHGAREHAKRWASDFVMPTDDELAALLKITAAARPGEFRDDLQAFKRAFLAVGRLGRSSEPNADRFWESSFDDANAILRGRRLGEIDASMFIAACLAWGDVQWRAADKKAGQLMELSLAKLDTGTRATPIWKDIIAGRANVRAPLPPRGGEATSSNYPTPKVKIYQEGADGRMHLSPPATDLRVAR